MPLRLNYRIILSLHLSLHLSLPPPISLSPLSPSLAHLSLPSFLLSPLMAKANCREAIL